MKKRLIWCVCAVCFALILIYPCAAVLCQDVYVEKTAHLADWQAALRDPMVLFSENGTNTGGITWYYRSDGSDATVLERARQAERSFAAPGISASMPRARCPSACI